MADDRIDELTEAALRRVGLEDVRPTYRRLLVQLKQENPEAFEEASRRYREDLVPAISRGDDPIAAWLGYGCWLASTLSEGRDLSIDASGRARPLDPARDSGSAALILHLPDDARSPNLLLAAPTAMSEPQGETMALLVRDAP